MTDMTHEETATSLARLALLARSACEARARWHEARARWHAVKRVSTFEARLLSAAQHGDMERVRACLLSFEFLVTSENTKHLATRLAIQNDWPCVVTALLRAGPGYVGCCDRLHEYCLHQCSWSTCNYTPLTYAARHGATDTIAALVRLGADVDWLDANDRTPLSLAAGHQHASAARELLLLNANPNCKSFERGFVVMPLESALQGGSRRGRATTMSLAGLLLGVNACPRMHRCGEKALTIAEKLGCASALARLIQNPSSRFFYQGI